MIHPPSSLKARLSGGCATMKITCIKIYRSKLAGRHPVFAQVFTDEGLVGAGEAAIAYGVGATAAAGMIQDLAERFFLGKDPTQVEAFISDILDFAFWAKNGGPIFWAGVSALEEALWDIKGKAAGLPVYELLGGKVREKIRVYSNGWTLDANSPDEFARRAEIAVKDGYTALKMYPLSIPVPNSKLNIFDVPGQHAIPRELEDLAVARVKAVREAVGSQVEVMIDLSCIPTPDAAIRLGRRLEELGICWLEEPVDPNDLRGFEKIAAHLDVPLAAGERLSTRFQFAPLIETRAVPILQPDVGNNGGILETRKVAALAEAFGLRIAPHNCASPLATAAALHVDASTPNFMIQELFTYLLPETYEMVDHAPEKDLCDGYLPLPTRPGLGVELREEWLQQYLWAEVK
jgi:galactonate dehydratase